MECARTTAAPCTRHTPQPGAVHTHTGIYIYWLLYYVMLTADLSNVMEGLTVALTTGTPHTHTQRTQRNKKQAGEDAQMAHQPGLLLCHLCLHTHPQDAPLTHTTDHHNYRPRKDHHNYRPRKDKQIHTTLQPWDYQARLIPLSNDVHTNPGPTTPRTDTWCVMSLNVGGPHLSVKRWHSLLMEISRHSPHIVALQEVRFKTGQHHISWAAEILPDYIPITHTHRNPDTMFLVHNTYAKYVTMYPALHRFATCVKVSLPGKPAFHSVNMHGPFTIATREELDSWISNIPSVGILMGDFNDTIWATERGRKRWWHDKLSSGSMHDPAMGYHPNAQADTLHTRKTKRRDASLVSSDTWDSLGVSGYEHAVLLHAGDHKAMLIHILDRMHTATTPGNKSTGSVASWPSGLFLEFHTHMRQWARDQPLGDNPMQRHDDIYTEIKRFVDSHPPPQKA